MHLNRYARRDPKILQSFGDAAYSHTYDFEWYITPTQIGLHPNQSLQAEEFRKDFLRRDGILVLDPAEAIITIGHMDRAHPTILDRPYIGGAEKKEVQALIELLTSQEETYAFASQMLIHEGRIPSCLLTFSRAPPQQELYRPTRRMGIELRRQTLEAAMAGQPQPSQ